MADDEMARQELSDDELLEANGGAVIFAPGRYGHGCGCPEYKCRSCGAIGGWWTSIPTSCPKCGSRDIEVWVAETRPTKS